MADIDVKKNVIIFKNEIQNTLDDSHRFGLRNIMDSLDSVFDDKDCEEYKKLRKSILDNSNNYHRLVTSIIKKL